MQHRHDPERHRDEVVAPRVVLDYFFLVEKDNPGEPNPMLVMKDEQSGEVYGRVVEHRGLREGDDDSWIVSDVLAELKSWGHRGGKQATPY